MPLLDHFHPPLAPRRPWESFPVNWAGAIADSLNESLLPEGYFAEDHAQIGPTVEIDLATFTDGEPSAERSGGTATLPPRLWAPPAPAMVVPAAFSDAFEVLVFESEGGARLVGAIEIVSPGNKDRDAHRRAFAVKCASYLCRGIGLHRRYRDHPADEPSSRDRASPRPVSRLRPADRDDPVRDRLPPDRPRWRVSNRDLAVPARARPAAADSPPGLECRTGPPDRPGVDLHFACQRRRLI